MDSSAVTATSIPRSSDWPSYMAPFWFTTKFTFTNHPDITLYMRENRNWMSRAHLSVGVAYEGDYTLSTGLCMYTDGNDPDPPKVCEALETCCEPFSQNHALFEMCMADGSAGCCFEDGSSGDSAMCCTSIMDVCDRDYTCQEDYCCNGVYCEKCDNSDDCEGSWSEYSECSTTCGIGTKTRTYTITKEASGGNECPFTDNETYTSKCNKGDCPVPTTLAPTQTPSILDGCVSEWRCVPRGDDIIVARMSYGNVECMGNPRRTKTENTEKTECYWNAECEDGKPIVDTGYHWTMPELWEIYDHPHAKCKGWCAVVEETFDANPEYQVCIPTYRCTCYGDPHCINFPDSVKMPPPQSFDQFDEGQFTLFSVGSFKITQVQVKVGKVSIIETIRIEDAGSIILARGIWDVVSMDHSAVIATPIAKKSGAWPTYMSPNWFTMMYRFRKHSDITVFMRENRNWMNRAHLSIGVEYEGDYTETEGLCVYTDGDKPDPPVVCDALEKCCDPFSQNHAVFELCMSDGSAGCCPEDGSSVDSSMCCSSVLEICDVDYTCQEDYCCNGFYCEPCDNSNDCEGSWTEYSDCSATCGIGTKSRTYKITTEANGGFECPFEDNEIYSTKCNLGDCPTTLAPSASPSLPCVTEWRCVPRGDDIIVARMSYGNVECMGNPRRTKTENTEKTECYWNAECEDGKPVIDTGYYWTMEELWVIYEHPWARCKGWCATVEETFNTNPEYQVCVPSYQCTCYGDPHCITFEDSTKMPPPQSFDQFDEGEFTLFSVGSFSIIQAQVKVGRVAIIEHIRIVDAGEIILAVGIWDIVSMDSSAVTATSIPRSSDWPSYMSPNWFTTKYRFKQHSDITVYMRENRNWRSRAHLSIGISYENDYTLTEGLCVSADMPTPDPPIVCDSLETCCEPFSQNHAVFELCMSDGSAECCPVHGRPVDSGTCCASVLEICDVDYTCEEGYSCNGFYCEKTDNTGDCVGSWSEYSECSTTCGVGTKSRRYTITTAANGGYECPFANNEVYTTKCNRGDCPEPTNHCASVSSGGYHSCALLSSKSITCWASDNFEQVSLTPTDIEFNSVSSGEFHNCGLHMNGEITCWGNDFYGQVSTTPVDSDFIAVSSGGSHNCGLHLNGMVTCWGNDNYGQVSNTPSRDDFIAISSGSDRNCGLRKTGVITCWGYNEDGSNQSIYNDFIAVSNGRYHTCGLRVSGKIACWGSTDSLAVSNTPIDTNFVSVSSGTNTNCGLHKTGEITCWGSDSYSVVSNTPTDHGFVAVSCGYYHMCAMQLSGTIKCWGSDSAGQVSNVPPLPAFALCEQIADYESCITEWMCVEQGDKNVVTRLNHGNVECMEKPNPVKDGQCYWNAKCDESGRPLTQTDNFWTMDQLCEIAGNCPARCNGGWCLNVRNTFTYIPNYYASCPTEEIPDISDCVTEWRCIPDVQNGKNMVARLNNGNVECMEKPNPSKDGQCYWSAECDDSGRPLTVTDNFWTMDQLCEIAGNCPSRCNGGWCLTVKDTFMNNPEYAQCEAEPTTDSDSGSTIEPTTEIAAEIEEVVEEAEPTTDSGSTIEPTTEIAAEIEEVVPECEWSEPETDMVLDGETIPNGELNYYEDNADIYACIALCDSMEGCNGATFVTSNNRCYLKTGSTGTEPAVNKRYRISSYKTCTEIDG